MEAISLGQQRERIDQLARLIAERQRAEESVRSSFEARDATAHDRYAAETGRLEERCRSDKLVLETRHTRALEVIARTYEEGTEQAAQVHDEALRAATSLAESRQSAVQAEFEATREAAELSYKNSVRDTAGKFQDIEQKLAERRNELRNLEALVERWLRRRWCWRVTRQLPAVKGGCEAERPLERYADDLVAARGLCDEFPRQWAARFVANGGLFALFVFGWIALILLGVGFGFTVDLPWAIATFAVSSGLTGLCWVVFHQSVVRRSLELFSQFNQRVANAGCALDAARTLAAGEADQRRIALRQHRERELEQAAADVEQRRNEENVKHQSELQQIGRTLEQTRQRLAQDRDRQQSDVNRKFDARYKELFEQQELQRQTLSESHQRDLAASSETYERHWERLVTRWHDGMGDFARAVDAMNGFCRGRFPDWDQFDSPTHSDDDTELPAIRFGQYSIGVDMFHAGLSEFEDLQLQQSSYSLPAVLSFKERPSLLLEAWGQGRLDAGRCLQNVVLRLLTSLPAGKVRFTIIDPVGLGQEFSAFMHLVDYDEKLVTHRIWTETGHINQRLSDLTEHMEDVIQTYLRNEFPSIQDYNLQAGEVAEPYHVLVVANFPAGFSDEAAQRLLSIVGNGGRCGVFALISADTTRDLPRDFELADLEIQSCAVRWNGDRFHWVEQDVQDLPLALDQPPDDQQLTQIIRAVGQQAQAAGRVEVPFSMVAAEAADWWSLDSRGGIEVALGRAGATKLQRLRLGIGTAQHVLISGKTGSGKSTLLHALITNTSLYYSPDEVEFYLIDFKKGVEFKPYASWRLPHARVVAIESEREFGLSVLDRLDVELRRRGNLFRAEGVQDIRGYRDADPRRKLPRILLIIDEFQEFFVQDDKLAQDAALLLDRLVRQGRAFGIHVLLGSQTLAGAYSLARSTIGQMAVRIALQCSEADSHLILSEDNTAARLLSRPGEAIYNDANGLFEGNHPFQVVWLPAAEQEVHLRQISDLAKSRGVDDESTIVFEGNAAADPSQNSALRSVLAHPDHGPQFAARAWLGAAVAIKEATLAVFRRQSGSNLLVVGQQEEMAMGILSNCLISLAATVPSSRDPSRSRPDRVLAERKATDETPGAATVRFFMFDGTRPEAADGDYWGKLAAELPSEVSMVTPKTAANAVAELAAEVDRRVESSDESAPSWFVIVYNLSRFRDLRRSDDDFGFSSFDSEPTESAAKQFIRVLRDGPTCGVHTLLWCDTYNNVSRWFDRAALRDLDQRVLLQMSATDSSNLMDSPAAGRLGVHRAILYSEQEGRVEKFRPYGLPSADWLAWVRQQLGRPDPEALEATKASDQ